MNIHRIIWTPIERETIARIVWTPLLVILTLLTLLTSGLSQDVGDIVLKRRVATTGRVEDIFFRTGFTITGGLLTINAPASVPWSSVTSKPTTLTGYGITEFATEAFLLTPATDSLDIGDEGLGWVDGRLTLQTDAGSLQWYQDGGSNIMAWSDRLQADSLDISAVSIFTAAPAGPTSAGEAGQIAFDGGYLYVCVALNTWLRAALGPWTP